MVFECVTEAEVKRRLEKCRAGTRQYSPSICGHWSQAETLLSPTRELVCQFAAAAAADHWFCLASSILEMQGSVVLNCRMLVRKGEEAKGGTHTILPKKFLRKLSVSLFVSNSESLCSKTHEMKPLERMFEEHVLFLRN